MTKFPIKFIFTILAISLVLGGCGLSDIGGRKSDVGDEVDISGWQTYRNEEYGFEFKYPKEWGNIVFKTGNREEKEGNILCGPGTSLAVYGVPDEIYLHDVELSFSQLPINHLNVNFKILKFSSEKPILSLCKGEDPSDLSEIFSIDLLEDQRKFNALLPNGDIKVDEANMGHGKRSTFVNSNGIKILYYPDWYTSISTSIVTFYKLYSNSMEVEGHMIYHPYHDTDQEIELREYNHYCDKERAVIYWAKGGRTASKLRDTFNTFHEVMNTFKFVE